ncbi:hypothetical protein Tco_0347320 [Tanacetum coccineum]
MIVDLQRRLLSLEEITKQLKTGPSNVDHHDKTGNRSEHVPFGGFDHQSMEGVSQCMNVDEPYKNWNDVSDNFHVDGLDHQSVEGVRELINDIFDTPSIGPDSIQDVCVSELMDVDQPSLNVLDDVHIDSVVKDADKSDAKTVEVPLPLQKFPSKACLSPYMQPPSTEVKCRKRRREMKLKRVSKRLIKTVFGSDGNEIQLLPWKEDLTRSPTAQKNRELVDRSHTKRGWLSSDQFRDPNDDWAMTSPYLSDMLLRFEYPLYYVNGVKYGVPWFAINVEKVYFPSTKMILTGLSHNLPLDVDDPISVALAYRERMIEFY